MTGAVQVRAGAARAPSLRWRDRWPAWMPYAAGAWSLAYGTLALFWATGLGGFPFGSENDPDAVASVLGGVSAQVGAPAIAALGLVGAVVAVAMARSRGRGTAQTLALGFAWSVAIALLLVIPDYRVLVAVAYAPIILVGMPFGWPPGVSFLDAIPWPVINQGVCIAGGFLWAATAVAYRRRARAACGNCGRAADGAAGWTAPAAAARWGRWAVYVAVTVPVVYALTRWAWALGIPLGISEEFLREGQESGMWIAGASLATLALGGSILTLGLIQRWGETYPRWIWFKAGRRVPPALAIVPATIVSVLVVSAGLMIIRLQLSGFFGPLGAENWAPTAPELLWPLWGAALFAATLAYYYRRRGTCAHCGRR